MRNIYNFFKKAAKRGRSAVFGTLTVTGGIISTNLARAKVIATEARKNARRGSKSCKKQIDQYTAEIEEEKNAATAEKRAEQKRDKKALDHAKEQQAKFDRNAAVVRHRNALATEKAEEEVQLKKEKSRAEEAHRQAQEAQYNKEETLEDYEEAHGKVGTPGLFDRNPAPLIVVITCADVALTAPAMINSNMMPLVALVFAMALSGMLAYSSHGFGRDSFKTSKAGQRVWISVGLTILGFIAFIRIDSLLALLSVLILAALWAAGARASYLYYEKKQGFDIKKEKENADAKVIDTDARQTEIEAIQERLPDRYEGKEEEAADKEKKAIDDEVVRLEKAIEERGEDITTIETAYDESVKQGTAIIEAEHEKGVRKRGKSSSGGASQAAAIAGLLILFTTSCKDSPITHTPETHCVAEVFDKSISIEGSSYKETTASLCNYVKKTVGYTTGEYYADGVQCIFYFTGDYSIPYSLRADLEQGKPYAIADVPKREAKTDSFFNITLPATLDKVLAVQDTMRSTHLYRNTVHAFAQLNSCGAKHRTLLVLTDAIETGVINFGKYSPEDLQEQQDTIIQQLLKDTPLPDLNGIEVLLLLQPDPYNDALSYRAAQLFKTMWEQKGATVKVQHNL